MLDQRCARCAARIRWAIRRRDGLVCAACDADEDQLPLIPPVQLYTRPRPADHLVTRTDYEGRR